MPTLLRRCVTRLLSALAASSACRFSNASNRPGWPSKVPTMRSSVWMEAGVLRPTRPRYRSETPSRSSYPQLSSPRRSPS